MLNAEIDKNVNIKFVKIMRLIGTVFFTAVILIEIVNVCLINEKYKIYKFSQTKGRVIKNELKTEGRIKVYYEYKVNNNIYKDSFFVNKKYFDSDYNGNNIIVQYNETFPSNNTVLHFTSLNKNYALLFVSCLILIVCILSYNKTIIIIMSNRYNNMYAGHNAI